MENRIRLDRYDQSWFARGRSNAVVVLWWLVQGSLFRYSLQPMYAWRRFLLRLFGTEIGEGVQIRPTAKITYPWKLKIGAHTWIGDECELYSLDYIHIGNHCVVSQRSYLCTGSHSLQDPNFGLITKPIAVKDGAWVASDVFIYPGVTIHEMGVAAARSTVTKDIPAGQVYAGTPAKFQKMRFSDNEEYV
ncbi:putative colanic acid biosynthesis acetyltransferase [Paenibacillus glycinis]|uniref:Colanic acid biosynthesis acetyltransferase WcaF n=1 Tax=Paenibacillus glycinis TaxID=2697035 RepID=A0ABW9XMG7_9BACL|nr:putative colanic acid biosynthesis acetyltransferase [Paenibacillus glycinis]NBD23609.1 colanic acid biosynthesis acetyltransferase WcaF [Paenibacillus glycinis]